MFGESPTPNKLDVNETEWVSNKANGTRVCSPHKYSIDAVCGLSNVAMVAIFHL
jgi:hypothetical protein